MIQKRSSFTYLKAAAISGLLISAMQPALAYHLRGAICNHGGTPSITVKNQDRTVKIELATGVNGKSQVGLVIKGLHTEPVYVRDLNTRPITAVFEITDKTVLKYSRTLQCKVSVQNEDLKLINLTIPYDFDTVTPIGVPLQKVSGNVYSGTLPSSVIVDVGKEVPSLKISGNSPIVGCTIFLDGENFGFDPTNKSVLVDSISFEGKQLGLEDLGNYLGCDGFP